MYVKWTKTVLLQEQIAYFKTFGFLNRPKLFSESEMQQVIVEVHDALARPELDAFDGKRHVTQTLVESRPILTRLARDDRIYEAVSDLLGADFIWAGSEANLDVKPHDIHWHPDRKECDYVRMKIIFYLESVGRKTGCLRVIPGSHRLPLHQTLWPSHHKTEAYFGVPGADMPAVALESDPGDAVFFNQALWHGSFGCQAPRRYLGLKFAAKPRNKEEQEALQRYQDNLVVPDGFCIHERAVT